MTAPTKIPSPSLAPAFTLLPASTTAFLGVTTRGTCDAPTRCRSWGEYVLHFGGFEEGGVLAHAVHGFFVNGGEQAVIVSLSAKVDLPASALASGLTLIEANAEIGLVVAPGCCTPAHHEALLDHCEKVGLRFAILDSPHDPGAGVDRLERPRASSAGALYFPWIVVHDPRSGDRPQPPSGHLAGLFARVERSRGLRHPPANEVLRGAIGVVWAITQGENEILHPKGINAIRDFPRDGIRVWGERTLARRGLSRVSSKRRLDAIIRSVHEGTRYVESFTASESTPAHAHEVLERCRAFFNHLWQEGLLVGGEGQGFVVRCTLAAQTDEGSPGSLVLEAGIALSKPGRFVMFRVVHRLSEPSLLANPEVDT